MHIACARLLNWNAMLVDHVRLVDIKDLDMVRQCLTSDLKVSSSEGTVTGDLVQFDIVADLSEVDFFIKDEFLAHQFG